MSDPLKDIERDAESEGKEDSKVVYWTKELELARKREEKYKLAARRVVKLYEGEKHADNSFNILYANTETLLPAVYNQLPRPYVDRRFKDADPLGQLGAKVLERTLSALQDSGDAEYESFNDLMEQAALGALVPGRGLTWFRYDAKIETPAVDDGTDEGEDPGTNPETEDTGGQTSGERVLDTPGKKVTYETVCGEDVDYDEVLFGYARSWSKMPWVARGHEMTEEDVEESFGEEWVTKLKFAIVEKDETWKKNKEEDEVEGAHTAVPVTLVWEIWNKEKKQVLFFSPSYKDAMIKEIDDPLDLSGFFPCPQPLRFLKKRSKLTPTPLYTLYEEQAKELNRLTQRINRILHALKVRGFYDGTMLGLKNLFNADDNTFIEARGVAGLQEGRTLKDSVWMMPLKELIEVLRELMPARDATKATIFEITGIFDLMRGEGEASETATAANIKNRFGQARINRMQRNVQDYVRACLRIMGEIAALHFEIDTFAEMTNLPYAKPEEVKAAQQMQMQLQQQLLNMQQQHAAMQAPMGAAPSPGGIPGGAMTAPPPPPQPTPEMQQQMQQVTATLQKPKWEDIVALLRSDVQRFYRIDIETNSTIASDTAEDKQDITDALGAISNMFSSFESAVQAGAMPMPVFKSILLTTVRRFRFGREVEEQIQQMPDQLPPPPPPPGQPTPEEQAAAAAKAKLEETKATNAAAASQRAEQLATAQHTFDMAKLDLQGKLDQQKHTNAMAEAVADSKTSQAAAVRAHQDLEFAPEERETKKLEMQSRRDEAKLKVALAEHALFLAREQLKITKATNAENLASTQAANRESLSTAKTANEEKIKAVKEGGKAKVEGAKAMGEEKVKQTRAKAVTPAAEPKAEPKDDGAKDKLLLGIVEALKAPTKIEIHHTDKKK